MKIRPVGAELFHEDGWTDVTKLTVTFHKGERAKIPNPITLHW